MRSTIHVKQKIFKETLLFDAFSLFRCVIEIRSLKKKEKRKEEFLPEKDLMKLLGKGGEESGQRQDETSQDGRQPSRFATTEGHDQRCPQPAAT